MSEQPKAPSPRAPKATGYIISPWYDWLFFLGPPLIALVLGYLLKDTAFSNESFAWWGWEVTWGSLFLGIFIHAHLVLVFFRSHANKAIFQTHRLRFLVVPALLYVAMVTSNYVLYTCSVVATFWDVYHSGMQTFGFGRIYDSRAAKTQPLVLEGLEAEAREAKLAAIEKASAASRRLDWALNQLLYAGPIVAGAVMLDHFKDFEEFAAVELMFFTKIPAWMEGNQRYFTWSILAAGAGFLAYYVYAQFQLRREGMAIAWQRVFLYVTTGAVSLFAWGFNSWGEAFFIMNVFHALQYFGLVWAMEKKNLQERLGVAGTPLGKYLVLALFVSVPFLYGTFVQWMDPSIHGLWAVTLLVSLMHFWYDGFVWSVRKKQV
ncbi:hypothetical protein PPSIR1_01759 [Plesiocystis pacifica SIR-1]|uniref:Uncharacterized protein n=1 Tax=Plesiocystis pacifica SIR-1 TaxID=391625 RepID=A6G864_9BACT|nr:hypothetical protein [Plesiocystis pacifica]EDM77905.1 hypothetical protein PPSIR1_01759 [Plesiocystis pacifica SIR-1]